MKPKNQKNKLSSITNSFIILCEKSGVITHATGKLDDFLIDIPSPIIGTSLQQLWPKEAAMELNTAFETASNDSDVIELSVATQHTTFVQLYKIVMASQTTSAGELGLIIFGVNNTEQQVKSSYLQTIEDNFPFYFWMKNHEQQLLSVNDAYLELVNATSTKQIVGKKEQEVLADLQLSTSFFDDEPALGRNGTTYKEESYYNTLGELRWLEIWRTPLKVDNTILGSIGTAFDITDRKHRESELKQKEYEFRTLAENNTAYICRADTNEKVIYMNTALLEHLGTNLEAMIGNKVPTKPSPYPEKVKAALEHKTKQSIEKIKVASKGKEYFHAIDIIPETDENGKVVSILTIGRDISQQVKMQDALKHYAYHDEITGLPNRRQLSIALNSTIQECAKTNDHFAVLYIDLDGFKPINDHHGHTVGDHVLVNVSRIMEAQLSKNDILARIGGDEFVIILKDYNDIGECKYIVEQIIKAISTPFPVGMYDIKISASVGISLYPDHASDDEDRLLRYADYAMYKAKAAGRSRYIFFNPKEKSDDRRNSELIHDLRIAMSNGELVTYYQPIICIKTNKVVKAEALVRWRHPTKGFISPGDFIPLAEEYGLIYELGRLVFEEAAHFANRVNANFQHRLTSPLRITVNFSAKQFSHTRTVPQFLQFLTNNAIPGHYLSVELTESLLLEDDLNVAKQLQCLQTHGLNICLDDFGTGYSALSYLKKFNIDLLKIDRSFVRDIVSDEQDGAIVEAIILMAQRLNIRVVAEGVETQEQLDILAAVGCDMAQGYLHSPAIPEREFLEFLNTHNAAT